VQLTSTGEELVRKVYARVRARFEALRDVLDEERRVRALSVWADNFGVSLDDVQRVR
jgi:hypothetical protein